LAQKSARKALQTVEDEPEEKTTLLIEKPSRGEKIPWSLYTGIFRQSLFIRFNAILFSSKK